MDEQYFLNQYRLHPDRYEDNFMQLMEKKESYKYARQCLLHEE